MSGAADSNVHKVLYSYAWSAWRTVPAFVRRKIGVEDAIQEAAMHCWRVRDTFRADGAKKDVYMVLCARRHLIQLAFARSRQKNAAQTLSLDMLYDTGDPAKSTETGYIHDGYTLQKFLYSPEPGPVEQSAHNDELARLMDAVHELPAREWYAVWEHQLRGSTLEKIGEELGVSREAVRQTEAKGLRRLTAKLTRARLQP